MKKKRILHFSQVLGGGVEQYIKMYLKYSNFSNSVLLPSNLDINYYSKLVENIYKINISQSLSPIRLLKNIVLVRNVFKENNPDIIYLHSTFAGVIGRFAALGLGIKVIYNPHGWSFKMNVSGIKKIIYKLVEFLLSIITDKLIIISKSEYNDAESICISSNKLELIYNGIDINKLEINNKNLEINSLGIPNDRYIIGMVGRISEQKNPLFFVEFAYKIFQEYPNSFFIIVGDGELRKDIEQKVLEYGLKENFLITGWVESPEEYLNYFDQAVLFSKWEGLSLAVIEYMFYKKPIIVTNIDEMLDLIENNVTGFSIPIDDLNEVINKSKILREDKELSELFGKQAHEKVIKSFNISQTVKSVEELCLSLIGNK